MSTRRILLSRSKSDVSPVQPYQLHIREVVRLAKTHAAEATKFFHGDKVAFINEVESAAWFHDAGKLTDENQAILSSEEGGRHLEKHILHGTQILLNPYKEVTDELKRRSRNEGLPGYLHHLPLAPFLVYNHHRQMANTSSDEACYCVDPNYDEAILQLHKSEMGEYGYVCDYCQPYSGLDRRIAMSCLVDADHSDSATWTMQETRRNPIPLKAKERLERLKAYVDGKKNSTHRSQMRTEFFNECCDNPVGDVHIEMCTAPVGTGKTTAVMARLLRVAIERGYRRILVVLPYTNIITQAVKVYRDALTLPGEDPEMVVAENHHIASVGSLEKSYNTKLWEAPIVVTTSVQYFGTLASNRPSTLRKLHNLPGTAVFVDEAHASVPYELWGQTWDWLEQLGERWDVHHVLGSGSLKRFWENEKLVTTGKKIPDIISDGLSDELRYYESNRVTYMPNDYAFKFEDFVDRLKDTRGSQLVVVNTVNTAVNLARALRGSCVSVLHLSTVLTPNDRKKVLRKIMNRLNPSHRDYEEDWILVATSCVEAGVDFSFSEAWREDSSVASLIQTGGRCNRNFENSVGLVHGFRLSKSSSVTNNPSLDSGRFVMELISDKLNHDLDHCIRKEIDYIAESHESIVMRSNLIVDEEFRLSFMDVFDDYKVIDSDTVLMVCEEELAERIERGVASWREIQMNSVQVRPKIVENEGIREIGQTGIYFWDKGYDGTFDGWKAGCFGNSFIV